MDIRKLKVCFCMTGSFCTLSKAIGEMEKLKEYDVEIYPVFSYNAYTLDTRFSLAKDNIEQVETIAGRKCIHTIVEAEKIGPQINTDIAIIAPCTGNTLAKLINGIVDTPAVLAAKAHLRNSKPLVLAIATNDALSNNMKNIAAAINRKNIYLVPLKQDNIEKKKSSMVCDMSLIIPALKYASDGVQIQPIFN